MRSRSRLRNQRTGSLSPEKVDLKKSLKPSDKLRLKSEFDYVREHGTKLVGRQFLLVHAPAPDDLLRTGVICSKRYDKRAVARNRARRMLWESFRLLKHRIAPCHLVLITRKVIAGKKQQQVQKEMEYLLRKAGLLLPESKD